MIATLLQRLLPASWRERLLLALGMGLERAPLERALIRLAARKAGTLPPEEALRLLFTLDNRLYTLQGEQAQRWEGGTHPKHRVMAYHDFFITHLQPGQRVLDLGCGQGELARAMAERAGVEVVAIDLSEEKIATARARHPHPRVDYRTGDARTALPGERFDVVTLSNVLEHLPPSRPDFLRQVRQACQPRVWLIRVPALDRDWRVPVKRELGVEWRLDTTHDLEYTLEGLTAELTEAGLAPEPATCRWGEYWVVAHPAPDG